MTIFIRRWLTLSAVGLSHACSLDRASAAKKPDEELVGSLRRDLAKLQESVPLRRREAVVKSNQLSWTAYTEVSLT